MLMRLGKVACALGVFKHSLIQLLQKQLNSKFEYTEFILFK